MLEFFWFYHFSLVSFVRFPWLPSVHGSTGLFDWSIGEFKFYYILFYLIKEFTAKDIEKKDYDTLFNLLPEEIKSSERAVEDFNLYFNVMCGNNTDLSHIFEDKSTAIQKALFGFLCNLINIYKNKEKAGLVFFYYDSICRYMDHKSSIRKPRSEQDYKAVFASEAEILEKYLVRKCTGMFGMEFNAIKVLLHCRVLILWTEYLTEQKILLDKNRNLKKFSKVVNDSIKLANNYFDKAIIDEVLAA